MYVTIILTALAVLALGYFAVGAIGGRITVIDDWKRAFRYFSVWGIAVLGAWPDIYNAIVATGYLSGDGASETLTWGGRILAIIALLGRFISQKKPPLPDGADKAGA